MAPNKNYLFSGSRDKNIRVWNLKTAKTQNILKKHSNAVTCLCFTKYGVNLISGSADKSLCVWKIKYSEKGTKINKILLDKRLQEAHDETITCLVAS
jgi:WD40 repeat protein